MKNFKWGTESFNDKPIYIVLFVSRNKDNKDLSDFKERRKSFITHKTVEELQDEFHSFVEMGQKGELSRMYYSVNERDGDKIYKELMHFLFDNPDFNLCSLGSKLAGIAAKKECAKTKKFMFDFDDSNAINLSLFLEDLEHYYGLDYRVYKTPHGYAIVTEHGFDTRELLEKWKDFVTLKRDDLLCVDWKIKGA
jgi:hypothetical protein